MGDKYGMDIYTDCVLDLSVINCNKLITIASIIAINFWSEITKGYSLKFKYICKSVHIIKECDGKHRNKIELINRKNINHAID